MSSSLAPLPPGAATTDAARTSAYSPCTSVLNLPSPSAVVVRSRSVHRRQMETRLRLCRRLLRVNGPLERDSETNDGAHNEENTTSDSRRQAKGKTPVFKAVPLRPLAKAKTKTASVNRYGDVDQENDVQSENDSSGNDDAEDAEEGDGGDEGDEEADDDCGDDETVETKPKREKCEPSVVVKLLFSRSDPHGRAPTVWFDYPPHLHVTREPPTVTTGSMSRLVTVDANDCALFFKTHWERNCVKNAFAVAGLRRTKKRAGGWHVAWAKHMTRDKFRALQANQVFSHFPDPWVIGRKDRLMKTLTTYKRRFGASYAFFPEGLTLPDHIDAFKRATSTSPKSLWILKPPAAACGKGIRVLAASDVDTFLTHEKRRDRKYIAQKYIANPLLVDGFKFDLRIYVLVTSVDPLRIYLFEEGLTRFCTTPYSLGNTKNRFAHLTNYSVNRNNKLFVENANAESDNTGNKWSMTALLEHLKTQGIVDNIDVVRQKIKDVICKTVVAAEAHLTPLMHQFVKGFRTSNIKCFELFGFDLMLDDTCTPWLIEANVSPSLMAGSPLDRKIKGLLLSDIFHLVGVPVPRDSLPQETIPEPSQLASSSNNSAQSSGNFSSRSSNAVNKQLHEIVLDAKRPVFEKKDLELFTPADWTMIYDMEDEMERLGHFERIYPCASAQETAKYALFFTCPRYSNALCSKWIETKNRDRAKAKVSAATVPGKAVPPKPRRSNSVGGPTTRTTVARSNTMRVATLSSNRVAAQTASR